MIVTLVVVAVRVIISVEIVVKSSENGCIKRTLVPVILLGLGLV